MPRDFFSQPLRTRSSWMLLCAALSLVSPWTALGARPATPQRRAPQGRTPQPPPPDPEPLEFTVPVTDQIIGVIDQVALSGSRDAATEIGRLLLHGIPPRAAAHALQALSVFSDPTAANIILRFVSHRRPMLRRHAIAAAETLHTPELIHAIESRLSDSDSEVRIQAATSLGNAGNRSVVPTLFLAFERSVENIREDSRLVHETARSIAKLGVADDVRKLLGFITRVPFPTVREAMSSALERRDLPQDLKLAIVTRIGDLGTPDAAIFLDETFRSPSLPNNLVVRTARDYAARIAH